MKQISKRLTYANVMSSIAVFLVLGGATAFAATKIGADQLAANSVKTGKIVKEAVTTSKLKNSSVNTAKLADGAVTTAKIADKAITGAKIDAASVGTVPNASHANSANTADTATTAQNLSGLYFAVVNSDATIARATPGVTAESAGSSAYRVFVPEGINTKTCFFVGSLGGNNTGNGEEGQIALNPSGTANALYITTYNSAGALTAKQFTVMIRC